MNTEELIIKINNSGQSNKVYRIIKGLQALEALGQSRADIDKVINDMNLPLGLHLFIAGNYSNLIKIKINI